MRYRWVGIILFASTAALVLVPPLVSDRPNAPYPADERGQKVWYLPFSYPPVHLDPAVGYSESVFLNQIYEPVFQYGYLKRPYVLEPLTCKEMPVAQYFDHEGKRLPADGDLSQVARVTYEIRLKEGIRYHPHPCFAKTPKGEYAYHALTENDLKGIRTLDQFPLKDTRELVALDYVHQIKRLCIPNLTMPCPILSTLDKYIDGMADFSTALQTELKEIRARREKSQGAAYIQEIDEREHPIRLDLDRYPLSGVEPVDRYTFRIHLKRPYPQILYWMAMHFFAPVPWEATAFYEQTPLIDRNITLDRCPVGTGPFHFETFDPNRLISLVRNPEFREEYYPAEGAPGDLERGLLESAGRRLPLLDKIVYFRERESVPTWIKFLQGYYDLSGIGTANFDQGVKFTGELQAAEVGDDLREKGIELRSSMGLAIHMFAFNMRDPVFGGYGEKQRKLRHAIAIAMDTEEYLQIFQNGMGVELHGVVPEGIFGYQGGPEGINPYVFDWDAKRGRPVRKSLGHARQLLAEAGYPGGVGSDGRQLVVNYDNFATGGGADAYLRWLSRQFGKLNIAIVNRTTDYSTFANRASNGEVQMFSGGWMPDYPDPENYLFMLYGPNGLVKHPGGANMANYENEEYDRLFREMLAMPNAPERHECIRQMQGILQRDMPWFSVRQGATFSLSHQWVKNFKHSAMAFNSTKYVDVDATAREAYRRENNQPVRWPIYAATGLLLVVVVPALRRRIRKEQG